MQQLSLKIKFQVDSDDKRQQSTMLSLSLSFCESKESAISNSLRKREECYEWVRKHDELSFFFFLRVGDRRRRVSECSLTKKRKKDA